MNNIKISRFAIGKKGERIVADILTGSKWANEVTESRQSHDIEWEGICIDVKTCSQLNSKSKAYIFSLINRMFLFEENHIIFVLVGLNEKGNYFWVKPLSRKTVANFYAKISDAVSEKELPEKIREVYKKLLEDKLLFKEKS